MVEVRTIPYWIRFKIHTFPRRRGFYASLLAHFSLFDTFFINVYAIRQFNVFSLVFVARYTKYRFIILNFLLYFPPFFFVCFKEVFSCIYHFTALWYSVSFTYLNTTDLRMVFFLVLLKARWSKVCGPWSRKPQSEVSCCW